MKLSSAINRRLFLKSAGMTALASAATTGTSLASGTGSEAVSLAPPDGVFDFDTPYDRVGTDCIKWDSQIEKYGRENVVVGMGIADMDFEAAPCITEALEQRCKHRNWGYMKRPTEYVDAIVKWNKKRYGVDVEPDSVVLASGVHPGLIAALKTFSPPGSKVLLTTPTYNGFYFDLHWSNTVRADSPMILEDGVYSINFADLERRIDNDTHALILCNPQNPTGNCWSKEDLMRLGELCLERRVVLLSDEIHCDFVMKGQTFTPFASLPDKDVVNNSMTFKASSKTFSLAAMKSAWFYSTNEEYLDRVKKNHRADLNTLGVVANQAALTHGEPWLDQLVSYIDGNHDYVEKYIGDKMPMVSYKKAQGTYLAWLDVSDVAERIGAKATAEKESTSDKPVTTEQVVERWFVDHAKVQLNAGASYGTGGAGHMRMNLGTSRQLIQVALENMAEALDKL